MFQSNGLCYTFCNPTYSFAILQGFDCWCSDFAPGTTTTLSDCYTPCPGYPDDMCASSSLGLFGYIALPKVPAGTQGGSASSSSSKASRTTTPATPTPSPPVSHFLVLSLSLVSHPFYPRPGRLKFHSTAEIVKCLTLLVNVLTSGNDRSRQR